MCVCESVCKACAKRATILNCGNIITCNNEGEFFMSDCAKEMQGEAGRGRERREEREGAGGDCQGRQSQPTDALSLLVN